MRAAVLILFLALSVELASCRHATPASGDKGIEEASASAPAVPQIATAEPPAPAPAPASDPVPSRDQPSIDRARVDFNSDVRPILEAGCQPCHFPGGIMYERRPFDRPETITTLGTKLFTRIKDEDERRIINEFLAQQGAAKP
jgi:hypothetical protein